MSDHLIVDGDNVVHALRVTREALAQRLELAAAQHGVPCTVVFDGAAVTDVAFTSSAHLTVTFAGPHSSADTVIERLVCQGKRAALKGGPFSHLVVVTNDRTVGNLAVGWGARCWSTAQLARWLSAAPDQE